MTPPEFPQHVTKEMCLIKHTHVEQDIRDIKAETQKINNRLWSVLIMVIAQLFGVIMIFIKGCAL